MGFDAVLKLWWDFWQIPYFRVFETKGNKVVKIFNQKVVNSDKSSSVALIDKSNKLCWWISSDYIVNKSQMMFIVDINNAIPLKVETISETTGNIILKEKTTKKLSVDKKKISKETTGKPKETVEIQFPPELFYEILHSHFVEDVLSEPPSKWEDLKWVFIVALIVAGFLLYNLMNSGITGVK